MGRPLKGSISKKGGSWVASVPRYRGAKSRVEASFATESEARGWVDAQIDRLNQGLEVERPDRAPAAAVEPSGEARPSVKDPGDAGDAGGHMTENGTGPDPLESLAFAWHHEHYVQLHGADAERTKAVMRQLENHILPAFRGLLGCDVAEGRRRVTRFIRTKAGYPANIYGNPPPKAERLARGTVSQLLWLLTKVLRHGHLLGHDVPMVAGKTGPMPAYTVDMEAIDKRGEPARKARLMSLPTTKAIAAQMHVIHPGRTWVRPPTPVDRIRARAAVVAYLASLDPAGPRWSSLIL